MMNGCENNTRPYVLNLLLGEKRIIQFEVISTKNEPVVIVEAGWVLTYQNEVVASGDVTLKDNSTMEILLEPETAGTFDLTITYTIAPEVRKVRCKVLVR